MYTVDYFISKFRAIPENKWITNSYGAFSPNRCALGHCGVSFEEGNTMEGAALVTMFLSIIDASVTNVNDSYDVRYAQPTPKRRILAALRDIKEAQ